MNKQIITFFILLVGTIVSSFAQADKNTLFQGQLADSTISVTVTVLPEFEGFVGNNTDDRLQNFINDNLVWPKDVDCKGTVIVGLIVEKDGKLSNFTIVRGLDSCEGFNQEALRVVRLIPKFKPGSFNGEPVRVNWLIPVKFEIK
jgi:hypothetical protein